MKTLVIEDDEIFLNMVIEMLITYGLKTDELSTCLSVEEAIDHLNDIDILITDYNIGDSTADMIFKRLSKRTKVGKILMSGCTVGLNNVANKYDAILLPEKSSPQFWDELISNYKLIKGSIDTQVLTPKHMRPTKFCD